MDYKEGATMKKTWKQWRRLGYNHAKTGKAAQYLNQPDYMAGYTQGWINL